MFTNVNGEGNTLPMLVACDWLQFWCLWDTFEPDRWKAEGNFKFRKADHGTRVFKEVWEVAEKSSYTTSRRDEPFCSFCAVPHSPIIDAKMVLVKIENRQLYHANLYKKIALFLKVTGFRYQSLTRLDVSCDFVGFISGIRPLDLIEGYQSNRYLKTGSRTYADWKTAPYTATTAPSRIDERVLNARHVTHSISWGGANSDVHVKMYNKSREIRVESHKLYIKRWWKANGLDTEEDVWRVEISVGGRSRALVDTSNGELISVSLLEACSLKYLTATFTALAQRHFSFVEVERGKTLRKAKPLQLFDLRSEIEYKTITMPGKADPTRTVKVVINFLRKLPEEVLLELFCKSGWEANREVYRCLVVLSEVYDALTIVDHRLQWNLADWAERQLNDTYLREHMGVVERRGADQYIEDLAAIIESNDKRRALEESLYVAYQRAMSTQREGEKP